MAKYQLVIDDHGRALLACPEKVDTARGSAIKAAFTAWLEAQPPELLIAGETEIVRVTDVELALAPEASS